MSEPNMPEIKPKDVLSVEAKLRQMPVWLV
jgi:hypothetical protein